MSLENADRLLDPEEAAETLSSNVRTLANWRSVGAGPDYVKIGRLVRYPHSALVRYMRQHMVRVEQVK